MSEGNDVFYNHFSFGSYFDLTPDEAKKELKRIRKEKEYISDDDWKGLNDIIASKNDEKFFSKIDIMTPEETHRWFLQNRTKAISMSSMVWRKVHEVVSPVHEPILLEMLKKVSPAEVSKWVARTKLKAFFFTEHAYQVAKAKYETRRKK